MFGIRAPCERQMPAIETPCTKVCTLDPVSRLCRGCGRTLREIECWSMFDSTERLRVMAELPGRRAAHDTAAAATGRA
jgi:predicted Fe-S protein YdhL (DUF1289 family)